MLSIKKFGAATLVSGCVFLLDPGSAEAVTIKLDGIGEEAPEPLIYAVETLGENTPIDNTVAYHLRSPGGPASEELKLAVGANQRISSRDETFVRLQLGWGMVFRAGADPSMELVSLFPHPKDRISYVPRRGYR